MVMRLGEVQEVLGDYDEDVLLIKWEFIGEFQRDGCYDLIYILKELLCFLYCIDLGEGVKQNDGFRGKYNSLRSLKRFNFIILLDFVRFKFFMSFLVLQRFCFIYFF